jgi:hypothetical protein
MMTLQQVFGDAAFVFAAKVVATLLVALLGWLGVQASRLTKNALVLGLTRYVQSVAENVVLGTAERVRNLKDPAKPGTWDATTQAAIASAAADECLATAGVQVRVLLGLVRSAKTPRELAMAMVEAEVARARQRKAGAATLALPGLVPASVAAPHGAQGGYASVTAMLGLLALGLALAACLKGATCEPLAAHCTPEGAPVTCSSTGRAWINGTPGTTCAATGQVCRVVQRPQGAVSTCVFATDAGTATD